MRDETAYEKINCLNNPCQSLTVLVFPFTFMICLLHYITLHVTGIEGLDGYLSFRKKQGWSLSRSEFRNQFKLSWKAQNIINYWWVRSFNASTVIRFISEKRSDLGLSWEEKTTPLLNPKCNFILLLLVHQAC